MEEVICILLIHWYSAAEANGGLTGLSLKHELSSALAELLRRQRKARLQLQTPPSTR